MARQYTTSIQTTVSVSPIELIQLPNASGGVTARIRRVWIKCVDQAPPANQNLDIGIAVYDGPTNGTGGTTGVVYQVDPGDAVSIISPTIENTTPTAGGTLQFLRTEACFVLQGLDIIFTEPLVVNGNNSTFSLVIAPTIGSVNLNVGVDWEEIG